MRPIRAVPLRGEPRVAFNTMTNTLTIDITSPTGIGSTRIEKTSGEWSPKIVMRLRVKGLESFKFRYADTIIDVNVSSHGDQIVTETYQQGGQTSTLSAGESLLDCCDARTRLFRSGSASQLSSRARRTSLRSSGLISIARKTSRRLPASGRLSITAALCVDHLKPAPGTAPRPRRSSPDRAAAPVRPAA